jgi:hypothetical protein
VNRCQITVRANWYCWLTTWSEWHLLVYSWLVHLCYKYKQYPVPLSIDKGWNKQKHVTECGSNGHPMGLRGTGKTQLWCKICSIWMIKMQIRGQCSSPRHGVWWLHCFGSHEAPDETRPAARSVSETDTGTETENVKPMTIPGIDHSKSHGWSIM